MQCITLQWLLSAMIGAAVGAIAFSFSYAMVRIYFESKRHKLEKEFNEYAASKTAEILKEVLKHKEEKICHPPSTLKN